MNPTNFYLVGWFQPISAVWKRQAISYACRKASANEKRLKAEVSSCLGQFGAFSILIWFNPRRDEIDTYVHPHTHTYYKYGLYFRSFNIYIYEYVDIVYQIYVMCTCISLWISKGPRRTLQNVQEMEVFDPAGWADLPNSPGGSQAAQRGLFDLTWELDTSWSFKTWMWHVHTFSSVDTWMLDNVGYIQIDSDHVRPWRNLMLVVVLLTTSSPVRRLTERWGRFAKYLGSSRGPSASNFDPISRFIVFPNEYVYIYIYIHTTPYHTVPYHTMPYRHTYKHTVLQTYRYTGIQTYRHTCIHSYTCIYLVADSHHPKKTIREPSHVAHVAQCCRATAENLEQLEEELKAVMEKELAACGPHQSKLKEDLGWWGDADGCTPWACAWGLMEWWIQQQPWCQPIISPRTARRRSNRQWHAKWKWISMPLILNILSLFAKSGMVLDMV